MVRDYGVLSVSFPAKGFDLDLSLSLDNWSVYPYLVELILQLSLRTLRSRTNSLRIVSIESSTGLGMVQLRSILIITSNQQRNTERSAHDTLLTISTLSETQRQITDRLRTALHSQRLVVVEGVVLGLDAGVLDHAAGVGLES